MSYDHPILDEPVFEKIFPGPKPSTYFRASKEPHRVMLSIAEDFHWILSRLEKSENLVLDDVLDNQLPSAFELLDLLVFYPSFQDCHLIEKSYLTGRVLDLNLLPEKEGQFLWENYFLNLRCSYEESEDFRKGFTKAAFYNHRNRSLNDFFALLGTPFEEIIDHLSPEQRNRIPSFLLPSDFPLEFEDPRILSSAEIPFCGPMQTDLEERDFIKIRKRLIERKDF